MFYRNRRVEKRVSKRGELNELSLMLFVAVSLYIRSFCTGITEFLDGYRQRILQAEEAVLQDPSLPLTFLLPFLGDYPLLMQTVYSIVREIEAQQLIGGALLNFLSERAQSGVPCIRDALSR